MLYSKSMKNLHSRIPSIFLLGLTTVALSSCSLLGSLLDSINNPAGQEATNGVSRTGEGEGWYSETTPLPLPLSKVGESSFTAYLPSKGTTKLLVLPIEFSDSPFSQTTLSDLQVALGGEANQTAYWESVASFYEKSSYGKVHLEFEMADVYKSGMTQREVYNANVKPSGSGYSSDNGSSLVRAAQDAYKAKMGADYIKNNFDVDKNGWIDGIIAVYSGQDCVKGNLDYDKCNYFWAYTYWCVGAEKGNTLTWTAPSVADPTPNLYFWLSYDFIYEAVKSPRVDAHTLIHETGHMFGLDDYYPEHGSGNKFNAAGCWSMMDQNILDHDIFSKLILGWVDPIIVTGSGSVTINPAPSSGDCILFPGSRWNETVYDEYILAEFYTPTNLNYLDSHYQYPNRMVGYFLPGVKIYHVDARLVSRNKYSAGMNYQYVEDPKTIPASTSWDSKTAYRVGATNCHKDPNVANESFSLLHLMEAIGFNTFKNDGYGDNNTLFHTGGEFSMAKFGDGFFPKKTTLNSGATFDYTIKIGEITANSATISFTKK